nr:hypothetical protein [Tanacetum cinerariifolium]
MSFRELQKRDKVCASRLECFRSETMLMISSLSNRISLMRKEVHKKTSALSLISLRGCLFGREQKPFIYKLRNKAGGHCNQFTCDAILEGDSFEKLLEDIHVTWTQFRKKHDKIAALREVASKSRIQCLETASQFLTTPSKPTRDGVKKMVNASELCWHLYLGLVASTRLRLQLRPMLPSAFGFADLRPTCVDEGNHSRLWLQPWTVFGTTLWAADLSLFRLALKLGVVVLVIIPKRTHGTNVDLAPCGLEKSGEKSVVYQFPSIGGAATIRCGCSHGRGSEPLFVCSSEPYFNIFLRKIVRLFVSYSVVWCSGTQKDTCKTAMAMMSIVCISFLQSIVHRLCLLAWQPLRHVVAIMDYVR